MKPKYKFYKRGEELSHEDFTKLYKDGFNRTCQMFFKMGYSPEDCEELAQEVYLLCWKKRHHLVGSPVTFWMLQFHNIIYNIKSGRYSSPIDALVVVRNSEREDLLGQQPPPDEEPMFLAEDFLVTLPDVVQQYFRDVIAGYTVREIEVMRANTGIYRRVRNILTQPDIKQKLLEYLRG